MGKKCLLYIFLSLLVVVACSTIGNKLDPEIIREQIIVGETTKVQLLALCGQPAGKKWSSDHKTEIWHYAYVKKHVTAKGVFSNIVGIGTETKSHRISIDIELIDDVVSKYQMNTGDTKRFHFQ